MLRTLQVNLGRSPYLKNTRKPISEGMLLSAVWKSLHREIGSPTPVSGSSSPTKPDKELIAQHPGGSWGGLAMSWFGAGRSRSMASHTSVSGRSTMLLLRHIIHHLKYSWKWSEFTPCLVFGKWVFQVALFHFHDCPRECTTSLILVQFSTNSILNALQVVPSTSTRHAALDTNIVVLFCTTAEHCFSKSRPQILRRRAIKPESKTMHVHRPNRRAAHRPKVPRIEESTPSLCDLDPSSSRHISYVSVVHSVVLICFSCHMRSDPQTLRPGRLRVSPRASLRGAPPEDLDRGAEAAARAHRRPGARAHERSRKHGC